MATVTSPKLLTAEEYLLLPEPDRPTELVRGEIVELSPPGFRHGKVSGRIFRLLDEYAEANDCGHVTSNDSGVITEREPDTVRGADVAYFSYARLAKDEEPEGYPEVAPDLVFEVLSPSNRWPQLLVKVAEYLQAGVSVVVVVDPKANQFHVYRTADAGEPVSVLNASDAFKLPDILPGFSMPVGKLIRR
ncbi:MAG: Uma2 family endonuclease [Planctomycetaceae bacterium]